MSTVIHIDKSSELQSANDKLMLAWDLTIVLKGYLTGDSESSPAASLAGQIEHLICEVYQVTVDVKPQ